MPGNAVKRRTIIGNSRVAQSPFVESTSSHEPSSVGDRLVPSKISSGVSGLLLSRKVEIVVSLVLVPQVDALACEFIHSYTVMVREDRGPAQNIKGLGARVRG
jgi:hypothetical protein